MVERRSPKPDVVGSSPTWPVFPLMVCLSLFFVFMDFLKEGLYE